MSKSELSSVEGPTHAAESVAAPGPGRHAASAAPVLPAPQPRVIAYRRACAANGVGLAHYVLLTSAK